MKRLPLAIVIGVLWTSSALGASLMPQGKQAYFDANGDPLSGGKVYTYAAGTSTPLATYSDQAGITPNANPVVLDSRGEATIFWGAGPYKVSLYTSADVLVWTQDNMYPPFTAGDALGAALKLYSGGSAAEPELTWGDDTNSGLYLIGADNVGLSLGGTKRWEHTTAGQLETGWLQVLGTMTVTGAATFGPVTASGAATFNGSATFNDPVTVADALTVSSTLTSTFTASFSEPVTIGTATGSQHAATKSYVDGTACTATATGTDWNSGGARFLQGYRVGNVVTLGFSDQYGGTGGATSWTDIVTLSTNCRPATTREVLGYVRDNTNGNKYLAVFLIAANGTVDVETYDNGTAIVTPLFALGQYDSVTFTASYTVQ